jgi:hypothetical protein
VSKTHIISKQHTQIKRGERPETDEDKANKENMAKMKERLQNLEEKIKMMAERYISRLHYPS